MGSHPLNPATRLLLELVALGPLAAFGYRLTKSSWCWATTIVVRSIAALIWVTFKLAADSSRSGAGVGVGPAMHRTSGFCSAGCAMHRVWPAWSLRVFAGMLALHHVLSDDRVSLVVELRFCRRNHRT